MSLEVLTLEHLPSKFVIHVGFFRQVRNSAFLHQQLLARNPEFEYAFIDASAVLSRLHLLSAVFKAVSNSCSETLRTPNVHSETVVCLSPSSNVGHLTHTAQMAARQRNLFVAAARAGRDGKRQTLADQWTDFALHQIAEAYRRFGISPSTENLIVVKIVASNAEFEPREAEWTQRLWNHLEAHVEGKPVPPTDETITLATSLPVIRKYYKLNGLAWLDAIKDENMKRAEMEKLVLGAMALRGL